MNILKVHLILSSRYLSTVTLTVGTIHFHIYPYVQSQSPCSQSVCTVWRRIMIIINMIHHWLAWVDNMFVPQKRCGTIFCSYSFILIMSMFHRLLVVVLVLVVASISGCNGHAGDTHARLRLRIATTATATARTNRKQRQQQEEFPVHQLSRNKAESDIQNRWLQMNNAPQQQQQPGGGGGNNPQQPQPGGGGGGAPQQGGGGNPQPQPPPPAPVSPPDTMSPTVSTFPPSVAKQISTMSPSSVGTAPVADVIPRTVSPSTVPVATMTVSPSVPPVSPMTVPVATMTASPTMPPVSPMTVPIVTMTASPTVPPVSSMTVSPTTTPATIPTEAPTALTMVYPLLDFTISLLGPLDNVTVLTGSLESFLQTRLNTGSTTIVLELVSNTQNRFLSTLDAFVSHSLTYQGTATTNTTNEATILLSQEAALRDWTQLQSFLDKDAGLNVTIVSLVLSTGPTLSPTMLVGTNKTSTSIPLIAACAAGAVLMMIVLTFVVVKYYRHHYHGKPPNYGAVMTTTMMTTTTNTAAAVQHLSLDHEDDPVLDHSTGRSTDDDFSMADYSLASTVPSVSTANSNSNSATTNKKTKKKNNKKQSPEISFEYDDVGKETVIVKKEEEDEEDIDPMAFYTSVPPPPQLEKNGNEDVPFDECTVESEPMVVKKEPIVVKSVMKKKKKETTRETARETTRMSKSSKTNSPKSAELDSLSDFLKNRRDAKRASRHSP